jgi:hypothetical protein
MHTRTDCRTKVLYYAKAKKAIEAKAKAGKPLPPIAPLYQEGHISIDFNTKQAVMTLQKVEPKAKAPPLNENESRDLTWKVADNSGNLAKAERAAKAAQEAKYQAAQPVLQNQRQ